MRRSTLVPLLGSTALSLVGSAEAAPIKGTITLPSELKTGRRHQGYVRLENGIVPVDTGGAKGETIVMLTGPRAAGPPARTVTVDIAGLAAIPSVLVIGEGSVVEFKNADRVAHDLSTPEQFSLMPVERLSPGNVRRQKFAAAGGYVVRCSEYPHVAVSVLVVNNPFFATVDEKGAFRIGEAPEGSVTLKVWSQGRWVHEEHLVLEKDKELDLAIKVATPGSKGAE